MLYSLCVLAIVTSIVIIIYFLIRISCFIAIAVDVVLLSLFGLACFVVVVAAVRIDVIVIVIILIVAVIVCFACESKHTDVRTLINRI